MIHLVAHGTDSLHEEMQLGGETSLESSGDSGLNLASRGPKLKSDSEANVYVLKVKMKIQMAALLKGLPPEIINDDSQGGFLHQVFESVCAGLVAEYGTFIMEDDRMILNIVDAQINALWPDWQSKLNSVQPQ